MKTFSGNKQTLFVANKSRVALSRMRIKIYDGSALSKSTACQILCFYLGMFDDIKINGYPEAPCRAVPGSTSWHDGDAPRGTANTQGSAEDGGSEFVAEKRCTSITCQLPQRA
jgi:hypothetical protein